MITKLDDKCRIVIQLGKVFDECLDKSWRE